MMPPMELVMTALVDILQNTPWWVFVLFVVLLVLGAQALRPRTISLWRLLVIPAVFIAWGVASLVQQLTQSSSYLVADWLVGAALGAVLLWFAGRPIPIRTERPGVVGVAGSALPLARNMLIFFAKYGLGVAAAVNPAEREHLAIWGIAVSGMSSGYFLAWLAVFAVAYQRAPQRGQFAPQNR
jgi:hypothetical protein